MLARVAQAIIQAEARQLMNGRLSDEIDAYPVARAAVEAMRTLSDTVIFAGQATGNSYEGCDPEECWPAMIDAILNGA